MSEKSIFFESVLKNTPIALVIIGLIVLLIGAAGIWSNLPIQINELVWRKTVAIIGGIVSSIGVLLIILERFQKNQILSPTQKKFDLQITSPNKDVIKTTPLIFEISGTYSGELIDNTIQIYVVGGNEYYPIMKPNDYTASNGIWIANVGMGTEGNPGPKTIVVAVGGRGAQALYKYYWKVGTEKKVWVSIDMLPPDLVECDRVNVIIAE